MARETYYESTVPVPEVAGTPEVSRRKFLGLAASLAVIPLTAGIGARYAGEIDHEKLYGIEEGMEHLLRNFSDAASPRELNRDPLETLPGMPWAYGRHVIFDPEHWQAFSLANPGKRVGCRITGTQRDIFLGYTPAGDFEASNVELVLKQTSGKDNATRQLRMVLNPEDFDPETGEASLQYFQDGLDPLPHVNIPQGFFPRDVATAGIPVDLERTPSQGITGYLPIPEIFAEAARYTPLTPGRIPPPVVVASPGREDDRVLEAYNPDNAQIEFSASAFEFPGNDLWEFALLKGAIANYFAHIHDIMEARPEFYYDPRILDYTWEQVQKTVGLKVSDTPPADWPESIDYTVFNSFFHPAAYERELEPLTLPFTPEGAAAGMLFITQHDRRFELFTRKFKAIDVSENDEEYRRGIIANEKAGNIGPIDIKQKVEQKRAIRYLLNPIYELLRRGAGADIVTVAPKFPHLPSSAQLMDKELEINFLVPYNKDVPRESMTATVNRLYGPPPFPPTEVDFIASIF